MAELSQKVASRQARAKAFEQLPVAEVARLLTEFDAKKAAREKLVDRTVRTQYRTVRLAGDAVLERLGPAVQNTRFVRDAVASGRPEAIYVVSYVSRVGLVRAGRLHVHLNPQFLDAATDAGPYGYYPAGASLELPDGQVQQLEFTDPAPAEVSIEWDGRTGFAVAGGVPE